MASTTTTPGLNLTAGAGGDFARRGGQLRVSLTPRCQLGCWFCHNESEIPPRITHHDRAMQPRRRAFDASDFLTAINAMTAAGIQRVFFTGGEPLLSPLARPILQVLPEHQMSDYTTTLITNGLTLTRDLDWLATTALDRIKVSLHYFSDASIAAIAEGKPGDIAKIKNGIEATIDVIPVVELNLLLQEQNAHEVMDIIAYTRELGTGLQIIELVDTDHNGNLGGSKVPSSGISAYLRSIAAGEEVVPPARGRDAGSSPCPAGAATWPSRSSTRHSAATTSASAPPAPSGRSASKGSGRCAWTLPARSARACSAPICASTSPPTPATPPRRRRPSPPTWTLSPKGRSHDHHRNPRQAAARRLPASQHASLGHLRGPGGDQRIR
ncbi:radical SAM protein [Nonomuraea ceibae]|uniref:radical SAM protein n=1 Tax=Nonomuraea ceibae TaxID=1935170 RepID=UPI001C5F74B9|nr:radical SAM protein [Nonomuraea ceibae]